MLLSGSGRTLESLLGACQDGELPIDVVAVVSSVRGVRGLVVAKEAGIPNTVIRRGDFPDDNAYADAVYAHLAPFEPQLILLAGFLRLLVIRPEWEGRILNIHPALLPSKYGGPGMFGHHVHSAVIADRQTESGATVHVVTNVFDAGPVIAQARVPVLPGDSPDTLAARVFAAECALYPAAIRSYIEAHSALFGLSAGE